MSLNQSRSDKSETTQYRKTGRSGSSGQQRGFQGAGSGKGGGGVPTGPPPISSSSSPYSSNRSFKKSNNNAQGGQSRVTGSSLISEASNASAVPRSVQNGAHGQPPLHGASDAPVTSGAIRTTDSSTQKTTRPDPKAPAVHSAAAGSDATAPTTPAKGDGSRGFPFQFGSLSPGLMNGMQIPARTSSAPPNLDEQKRDQARHDSYRVAPAVPIPSIPKQHFPRKETGAADQSNSGEMHHVSKAKRETHVSSLPPATQTQKPSVHSMSGMSMQMPYHQPQVSMQFGGPNPQMQPQGLTVPMQMPLSIGSAPQVQQQMFVPGLQHHSMQAQGIISQGQGMNFATQMGPQLNPQIGNLGIGITPQYPQQQAGKFGSTRKPIKITDPNTHEELRLDKRAESYIDGGSSGMRSHTNAPPQSQPIPSFAPINYYSNSYGSSLYFPAPSSVPLTTQITSSSQAPRFNYSVSQGPQTGPYMNTSTLSSAPTNKTGTATHESLNLEPAVVSSAPSPVIQVTVKPASVSVGEKVGYSSPSIGSPAVEKGESPSLLRTTGEGGLNNPQRDSETSCERVPQQLKPSHEPPTSTSLAVASKEMAGTAAAAATSVESPASNALSSAPPAPTASSEESTMVVPNAETRRKESLSRSNSIKDHQKKPGKKGHLQPQNQAQVNLSVATSTLPYQPLEHGISFNGGVSESVEAKAATMTTPHALSKASESVLESSGEQKSTIHGPTLDASEIKADSVRSDWKSCEISNAGMTDDTVVTIPHFNQDNFSPQDEHLEGTAGMGGQEEINLPAGLKRDDGRFESSSESASSKFLGSSRQTEQDMVLNETAIGSEVESSQTAQRELEEPVGCLANDDRLDNDLGVSASTTADSISAETAPSNVVSSAISDANGASSLDASSSRNNSMGSKEGGVIKSGTSNQDLSSVLTLFPLEPTLKHEGEGAEIVSSGGGLVSIPISSPKDKPAPELNRSKSTLTRGKKKRKEILQKADALGTTSDLYMAYKGPEEKKETAISSGSTESMSSDNLKQLPAGVVQEDIIVSERGGQSKAEPDDWEDAADISTPKLETSNDREQIHRGEMHYDEDGNTILAKKYSRDFLLKFSDQCTALPDDFLVKTEIEALMVVSTTHFSDRESYNSPGRIIDRLSGGSRLDRRGSGALDDDKWSKPGYSSGRDMRLDIGYGGNIGGLRPGQGGSHGVLRNPRAQAPVQYTGGILSGPMQSLGPQGGMQRNSPGPDAERWQRATGFQKGLIPSPQTPLQAMHRAEKKYEVGKVTDEEQAKQRQLKAILNKLTPQNFEKLFEQVKAVNIDNAVTLTGVISQIFDKALMEPTFCEMYANFCSHLSAELPDFSEDDEKITFKRLLLNKCQEEFERGEREQEEANRVEEEGEIKQSEEEREEKRVKARRRMLGNIRLIGELYKKKMLTERIMHECINKLLGQHQTPEEEDVEALCKLMSTIGEMIDHPKAKAYMDAYFDRMADLSNNMELSSRVRFMLKDAIDLRKNKWQQRRKIEGPKKIEEVHRDAAQERQAQSSRLARGPGINPSARRVQPMDFGSRGSTMVPSPNAQMGGYRGLPTHARGFGTQDVRVDDRHPYDGRPLSIPLSQRPMGDDSITLGPQGGLARGMSIRGQPSMSTAPTTDISPSSHDPRRLAAGLNGYSSVPERTAFNSREDLIPRYMSERFAYDQSGTQERNMPFGSRDVRNSDRSIDRSLAASPHTQVQGTILTQSVSSEKVWPEERLRDMSIAAIKEFYSAKDEKEVALCVKDLNSPGFYPTMISIWVTDSFERKDIERDLLAKLLVNLTRYRDGVLSQPQLIKGFEAVLTTLEDAVNDAPKAAEFLGRIFATVILENVISLRDIGRLIYEGGEEAGNLREVGLAAEVLGSTLEMIKTERGDSVLNEIRTSSNLRLEDFKHSDPYRSRKLEMFI
ncbi:eukaryotic translation initiation factor 4G isoform X2 [Malania oleifera]|uniref:eukaryotic translation initiation factor 4G isoform X2 n=1 Tax=Malania oleifera TaxID=397392 RepID=UPI0025AE7D8A|nr:eukaryotic translation initiation factor 4G isoform X2 [Malania oleifera]